MTRILVVEDEPGIVELIALNLRHAGFEVEATGSAEEARRAVDRSLPALALVDAVPKPPRVPVDESVELPGEITRRFVPNSLICSLICAWAP